MEPNNRVRLPGREQQERRCLSVGLGASSLDHSRLDLGQHTRLDFIGPQCDFSGAMRPHGRHTVHYFVEQTLLLCHRCSLMNSIELKSDDMSYSINIR